MGPTNDYRGIMRAVYLFLLLLLLLVVGYFVADKSGWLPWGQNPPEIVETPAVPDEEPAAQEGVNLPSFDLVRVDRSGFAVIAGRAEPGSTVTLYANGEEIAREEAGPDGAWAINTETPLKSGPVELTITMTTKDGFTVQSDETVVIYVPENESDKPLVLRTTPGGASMVLQNPSDPDVSLGPLALETIDYDSSGSVIFAGRGTPGANIQIFAGRGGQTLPEDFVAQAVVGDDGRWSIVARIVPGIYTLLVVQLDQFGKPEYAIEVPFKREAYEDVVFRDGAVVVQPGNNLWTISRRIYGRGAQYTIIYRANADQIRDPDLIYPGQIFDVPEEGDENGDSESE